MKIGQKVYVPDLGVYGTIHEINWDKQRIQSIQVIDPITNLPKIIYVLNMIVQAVGLFEQIVHEIISFFRKPGKQKGS